MLNLHWTAGSRVEAQSVNSHLFHFYDILSFKGWYLFTAKSEVAALKLYISDRGL